MNKLFISTIILYSTAALSIAAASSIPDVCYHVNHYQSAKKTKTQSKKKLSLKKEAVQELEKRGIFQANYIDALCAAIVNNDIGLSKLIIATGLNVNQICRNVPDDFDQSSEPGQVSDFYHPLHYAASVGNAEIMKLLLQAGARPNVGYCYDSEARGYATPLIVAVHKEHTNCVKALLHAGANPDFEINWYFYPVHIAIEKQNTEILKLLLDAGAGLYHYHPSETTTLGLVIKEPEWVKLILESPSFNMQEEAMYAARYDDIEENKNVIKLLIEKGMDVNAPVEDEYLIHRMISNGSNCKIVELLNNHELDINIRDQDGDTPLLHAIDKNNANLVELLIKKGADTTIPDKNGFTPIIKAHILKHSECIEILHQHIQPDKETSKQIEKIVNIVEIIRNGERDKLADYIDREHSIIKKHINYFLLLAAEAGKTECVQLLLHVQNVKVNGTEALHAAANAGHCEIVNLLVKTKGIELNGNKALYDATEKGHYEIVKLLLNAEGIDVNKSEALHGAVGAQHCEIVKLLLATAGIDANRKSENDDTCGIKGSTPLELAVGGANFECVKLLLNVQGINTDVINIEDIYWLMFYVGGCDTEETMAKRTNLAQFLLAHPEISINIREQIDNNGWSGLHYAAQWPACSQMFLNTEKINVNIQSEKGETPLHIAARNENIEAIKLLLQHPEIDVNMQDVYGNTPLHTAVEHRKLDAIALLLNAPGINPYSKNKQGDSAIQAVEKILETTDNEEIIAKLKEIKSTDPLANYQGDSELIPLYYELKHRLYTDNYLRSIQQRLLHQLPRIIQGEPIDSVLESNNTTALHNACALGYYELVQQLLQLGASVHAKTEKGATVKQCIGYDPEGKIKALLHFYEVLNQPTSQTGNTPPVNEEDDVCNYNCDSEVCAVIERNDVTRLKQMLQEGLNPNSYCEAILEPILHRGLAHVEIVKLLLKTRKVDVNQRGGWRMAYTATMYACLHNYADSLKLLLLHPETDVNAVNSNVPGQALSYAMMYGHKECLKLLFESNKLKTDGYNPLSIAMARGDTKQLQRLLATPEGRKHLNTYCHKEYLFYPVLIQAVILREPEYVRMLLQCKELDVNIKDDYTWINNVEGDETLKSAASAPALIHAVAIEQTECVKLLLADSRTDLNCTDEAGFSAFGHAELINATNILKLLLQAEADVNKKNADGKTPRDIATEECAKSGEE